MSIESGPYQFKMHAFTSSKYRGAQESDPTKARVDQELAVGKILEKYQATNIKFNLIPGNGHEGGDKTRYNFNIDDKQSAIDCFHEISYNKNVC